MRFKDDADSIKLLADAFEAFMGAVYLDAGIGACRQLLARVPLPEPLRRYRLQSVKEEYRRPTRWRAPPTTATAMATGGDRWATFTKTSATWRCSAPSCSRVDFEACGLKFRHLAAAPAMTHLSFYMETKGGWKPPMDDDGLLMHNQRLEHLGDAALQLASPSLFHYFPEHQEGQLAAARVARQQPDDLRRRRHLRDAPLPAAHDDTMEEGGRAAACSPTASRRSSARSSSTASRSASRR